MGYKAYSDSYLMSLTKPQIIELLRVAEHNFFATEEALNNSAKAGTEIAEKFDKAKELLKSAVDDVRYCMHSYDPCEVCDLMEENGECAATDDDDCNEKYKWRYEAEALALIGEDGEQNENN